MCKHQLEVEVLQSVEHYTDMEGYGEKNIRLLTKNYMEVLYINDCLQTSVHKGQNIRLLRKTIGQRELWPMLPDVWLYRLQFSPQN